jgi:hypothetical protein
MAITLLTTSDWPSVWGMERRAEAKLYAGQLKEVPPQAACEDWVPITNNGTRVAVQAYDTVEEGAGDGGGRVLVAQGNEVCVLQEAVHHCQDQ